MFWQCLRHALGASHALGAYHALDACHACHAVDVCHAVGTCPAVGACHATGECHTVHVLDAFLLLVHGMQRKLIDSSGLNCQPSCLHIYVCIVSNLPHAAPLC